jgi:hypothetical protein
MEMHGLRGLGRTASSSSSDDERSRPPANSDATPAPVNLPQRLPPRTTHDGPSETHDSMLHGKPKEDGDMQKPVTGEEAARETEGGKPLADEEEDISAVYGATTQGPRQVLELGSSVVSEDGKRMADYAQTLNFHKAKQLLWLHGTLGVVVYEAVNLPNKDLLSSTVQTACFTACKPCITKAQKRARRIHRCALILFLLCLSSIPSFKSP